MPKCRKGDALSSEPLGIRTAVNFDCESHRCKNFWPCAVVPPCSHQRLSHGVYQWCDRQSGEAPDKASQASQMHHSIHVLFHNNPPRDHRRTSSATHPSEHAKPCCSNKALQLNSPKGNRLYKRSAGTGRKKALLDDSQRNQCIWVRNQGQRVKMRIGARLKSHMVAQTYPAATLLCWMNGVSGAQATSSPCTFLRQFFHVLVSIACMQGKYTNFLISGFRANTRHFGSR